MCVVLMVVLVAAAGFTAMSKNPTVRLLCGISRNDVRSALGEPAAIYAPDQSLLPSYGARPAPPVKGNREVWVYQHLMKLTFVYLDERGRVQMIFFTTT